MPPTLRIDWFRVLADLKRSGFSVADVSQQIAVPRATLQDWAGGAEPRHSDGENLLEFWVAACKAKRDDAPLVESCSRRRVLPRTK